MMKRSIYLIFCLIFFYSCSQKQGDILTSTPISSNNAEVIFAQLDPSQVLETIAFGSCNRQNTPQTIWPIISEHQPDLWIWLGDNIYGDSEDMAVLKEKYAQQMAHQSYRDFINKYPLIGIWDDHDYGVNDGDKNYPKKEESKALMLDFLNVPEDADVRTHTGAYQAYTFGSPEKEIKILLLDGRSFRDELERKTTTEGRVYVPNEEGDVLGEAQWIWLEDQLKNSTAKIHIIACGIQFISEEHRFEKWANFPTARKRLFDLLALEQVSNPILLSGDRHIAEVSKLSIEGLKQPVYEITASGMTHSYEEAGDEPNKHRISPLIGQKNFGLMQIDWTNVNDPQIALEIRGVEDQLYFEVEVK